MDQRTTARLAGLGGILFVATAFLGGGGPYFDDISNARAIQWVQDHHTQILLQGMDVGFGTTLLAFLVGTLLLRSRQRSPLVIASILAAGALVAADWVSAVSSFALADVGKRDGADQAILALFSIVKDMTYVDGYLVGVAVLTACVVSLRSRTLPLPLVALGVVMGVEHIVAQPVQIAATGAPEGITGPVGVALGLLWILATSIVLIARPTPTGAPIPATHREGALVG